MKFSKSSLIILAMSSALMGCGEEIVNVTLPTDTTAPGNNTVITKPEVLITDETQVSPLFKNYQLLGSLSSYKEIYPNEEIDQEKHFDYLPEGYYFAFKKMEDGNLKVNYGIGNLAFESNKITLDDNGYVNITFDNIGKIYENSNAYPYFSCTDNTCTLEYENDYELKLGGTKADLSYADYGIWKVKTTVTEDDGHKKTIVSNKPIYLYSANNIYGSEIDDEKVKFIGNTLAYMYISHKLPGYVDHPYTTYNEKDLTGTIELDFNTKNSKVDLKIAYDDWKTFSGTLNGNIGNSISGTLSDSDGKEYNFSTPQYNRLMGDKSDIDTLNNAEVLGIYYMTENQSSGATEQTIIEGSFGAKAESPINLKTMK